MRPSEGEWVRPLLARRRWETAAYCEAAGLVFARDLGNEDPRYVRTAIRREVVPAWERSLPGAVEAAGRAAEAARDAVDVMSALIDVVAGAVCPGSAVVSASRLEEVAPPLRRAFLHDWLGRAGVASVTRSGVDAVDTLAARAGSGEVALGEGWRVRKDYDRLLVMEPGANQGVPARIRAPGDGGAPSGPVVLPLPGAVKWGGLRLRGEPVDRYRAHDPRAEAFLDARVVTGPLVVRAVAEGDRIRPLGAPGSRSLQDVLVDARVPRRLRRRIPVVTCGDVILWVGGLVVAEECRIRVDTERIVRLAIERTGATPGQ
jgi:tRNA(Ile)-lysidine synthase